MPSILLINDNKIVSRLLQLSSQKHDYTLEEINDYTASEGAYNVIFIDSEKYDAEALEALKATLTFDRLGYIGDKKGKMPAGFDLILEKPFLPTDFVALMSENFKVMGDEAQESLDVMEEVGEDIPDLDALDEVDLDAPLELDEEIVEEIAETPAMTTLTTGIVTSTEEELVGMVDEIDGMDASEEILDEMDLDELIDDKVAESLEEVKEAVEEESEEKSDTGLLAAGVAAGAAVVAAVSGTTEEDSEEKVSEALNVLEGVEAIENEDDYLKENENIVEDLADEFDSLNEEEVGKLMAGEESIVEEVVSEEFVEGEEKVVESSDLEEMITRAVSKAITKEMLQEALNDMEITVTLSTKKS